MPRKQIYSEAQCPFHITARSHNRECFDLPMIQVWDIFSRYLYLMTLTYGVRIHAFVLMSNHFHLLITAPNSHLDQAVNYLLQEVSAVAEEIFEKPYHSTACKSRIHYQQVYKYVYRNPVEARLCKTAEGYPYSSLRGILGLDPLPFPAFDNLELIVNPLRQLSWLNTPFLEAPSELHALNCSNLRPTRKKTQTSLTFVR